MSEVPFNVSPLSKYEGPEFEEYCIREAKYLPASRDRSECTICPLGDLCQAGFEEQIRRLVAGKDPNLTAACSFEATELETNEVLSGLTAEQRAFVISKITNLG